MAAKSLKCGQCGQLLASVKEAQTHNEITGHSQFEESTEVLKVWRCSAEGCGKIARTDAEKGMHARFFQGHTAWEEVSASDAALDTAAQMKQARDEAMEEDDLLRAAMGKAKKKPASGGGAPTEGDAQASTGGAADDTAGTSTGGGANMVSPAVDEALLTELEGMGFGRNRSVRALYHTGGAGVEAAVNWIVEHESSADIDTPLLVTQASEDAAAKLTPEERKRKAQDLLKAARDKREREEKELAAHRERERIRAGKEMQLAKRKEEEGAMRRLVEQRAREKAEEAAARAKLEAQLEEDRKERRRRLGLPEELTEEEKAREAQKAAEKAAAAAAAEKNKVFGRVKPTSTLDKQRALLVDMKKAHAEQEAAWRTAATTLGKYLSNVMGNPDEEKFRTIRTSNAAYQQRVAALTGGQAFLELCGFKLEGEVLHLAREAVDPLLLQEACGLLSDMLSNPFFGAL